MNTLRAENLQLRLGNRPVLQDVSLTAVPGQVLGLLGPNGAGKSTLLRCLSGLLQPDAGDLLLGKMPLQRLSSAERSRQIAYLPQDKTCHWPLNVRELVTLGRLPHRAPWAQLKQTDHDAVEQALRDADALHLASRSVDQLSGGERTRVLLARSLAVQASFLLADEPITGLDPAHQLDVMSLLRTQASDERGVIVVLHDLSLASAYCDQLVLMDRGKIVAAGQPDTVLNDDNLKQVFNIRALQVRHENTAMLLPVARV